jgi:hypothetical protein
VNGGFPLNFDGSDKSLPTEKAQFVVALMLAAIYEAQEITSGPGFVKLDEKIQTKIVDKFKELEA